MFALVLMVILKTYDDDRAGGPLEATNGQRLLPMPPVGLVLDQRMIQKVSSADGDKKKHSFLDRDLFAVNSSVTDDAVTLHGFDVTVQLDSPASSELIVLFFLRQHSNIMASLTFSYSAVQC